MSTRQDVIRFAPDGLSMDAEYASLLQEDPRYLDTLPPELTREAFMASLGHDDRPPIADRCADIRAEVERGNLRRARELVARAMQSTPNDPDVLRWYQVVAPAVVRPGATCGADRRRDLEWLRIHASEHSGRWIAIDGGDLLDESPTLADLLNRIRNSHPTRTPLVEWIP